MTTTHTYEVDRRLTRDQDEMPGQRRLLAVFAHPDDEAYGPAATLAKYAQEGVTVSLFCATHGEDGMDSRRFVGADTQTLADVRASELQCSVQALGIEHVTLCDFGDGHLNQVDPAILIGAMVRAMRIERPQVVMTFGPEGLTGHADHIAVSHCCTTAFSLAGEADQYPEQLQGGLQPYRPSKLYYYTVPEAIIKQLDLALQGSPAEAITTVVDVTPFVELRLEAIRCHQSQRDAAASIPRTVSDKTKALLRRQNAFVLTLPPPVAGMHETCLFQGI